MIPRPFLIEHFILQLDTAIGPEMSDFNDISPGILSSK